MQDWSYERMVNNRIVKRKGDDDGKEKENSTAEFYDIKRI